MPFVYSTNNLILLAAVILSVTNKPVKKFNNFISLETDSDTGVVGSMFVFHLSYIDGFISGSNEIIIISLYTSALSSDDKIACLITEANTDLSGKRHYRNVRTFGFHIEKPGRYIAIAQAINIQGDHLYKNVDGKSEKVGILFLYVGVIRRDNTDPSCDSVGHILIDDKEDQSLNFWLTTHTLRLTEWKKVSKVKHTCKNFQGIRSNWIIEHINQKFIDELELCLNPRTFVSVNLADYTSQILPVPMPGPGKDSEFIIQPYTIPPGNYRICSTMSNNEASPMHCAYLRVVGNTADCSAFVEVIRINMSPELEEITWPLIDLHITVTRMYSIFAIFDNGFSDYSYSWRCSGDVLCKRLQARKKVVDHLKETFSDMELTGRGTELLIPAGYMTAGTTITLEFTVAYEHKLTEMPFVCTGSVKRKITFVTSLSTRVGIRCHLNCGYYVKPETPLLVGLECDHCGISIVDQPHIKWSISGLSKATIFGENTTMLVVKELGLTTSRTFYIRINVSYIREGHNEEINLGKMFRLHKPVNSAVLNIFDYLAETHESAHADPAHKSAIFPRYSISTSTLYISIIPALGDPVITTISVMPEIDEEEDNLGETRNDGLVLLRTLWSHSDVCIESFEAEDKFGTIRIEVSDVHGVQQAKITQATFNISRRVLALGEEADLMSLFLFAKDNTTFSVNDQTYLLVISRAIEIRARESNYTLQKEPDYSSLNSTTGSTNKMILPKANTTNLISQPELASTLQDKSNLSTNETDDIKPLSHVVEVVLDFMLSDDENGLGYSNINLYLDSLIRMLSIREYTVPVLNKAIKLLKLVHAFHETKLDDPASDDGIIRLKLGALHTITLYLLGCRKYHLIDNEWDSYVSNFLQDTYNIVINIADKQPLAYPRIKFLTIQRCEVQAFWVDPFIQGDDIYLDLNISKLTIDIKGLRSAEWFDFALDKHINVAVDTSQTSALLSKSREDKPNAPVLHVIVRPKHPTLQPFSVFSPGQYNISYVMDMQNLQESNLTMMFGVYRTKDQKNLIEESDCYLFSIEASTSFASIINVKPTADVNFGLKIVLTHRLSVGLKAVEADEIVLSKYAYDDKQCKGVPQQAYSIFLPAVTLRQRADMHGDINYYILMRVIHNQKYGENNIKTGPFGLVEIGQVAINFSCVHASCLQFEEKELTYKGCQVNPCTWGSPSIISCRCDRGNTFTAKTKACKIRWRNYERTSIKIQDFDELDKNFMIPAFILSMYLIFGALLIRARRLDRLERPLGKTLALEGVYSPLRREQYLICLVTGFGAGCGTKSIPYLTIVGTNQVSPRYKLETDYNVFMEGSEIWLLISAPKDLGRPRRIVLSLESDKSKISRWFVKELYIRQISSKIEWTCFFNTWIPNPHNVGLPFSVEDTIKKREKLKITFANIFLRLLRNEHPVFGIRYNIPGSDFTKAQHVVLSLCGLFILMLIILLAHNLPTPILLDDYVIAERFTLHLDFYFRATLHALAALMPVYLLGKLLDKARSLDSRNVEWRNKIKYSKEQPSSLVSTVGGSKTSGTSKSSKKFQTSSISSLLIYMPVSFSVPQDFCLVLMIAVIVCISYYIFALGLFFSTTKSLDYLYIVCAAFAILMSLLYPFLLVVVAIIYTILYACGKSYYGVGRESEYRVDKLFKAELNFYEIAKSGIVESRTQLLGDVESHMLSDTTRSRSHAWCKQLKRRRKAYLSRKHIRYSNFETLVFLVITTAIINCVAGSIRSCFLQTYFISRSLNIGRGTVKPNLPLTTDTFWDHLMSMFSTINMWRSNDSINSFTVLTAVRVRQVRAKAFAVSCIKNFKGILSPKCQYDVEDSIIETRAFANSWLLPVPPEFADSGPYTYSEGGYFSFFFTSNHRYPGGGYDIMVPVTMTNLEQVIYLRNDKWVDQHTKALVVNMNVHCSDSGLSTFIKHVYEFRLTGISMYTSYVYTFPLKLTERNEIILSFLVLVFAFMNTYFFSFEIRACFSLGLIDYFSFAHSWLLLAERCLSIGVLVIYFWLKADKDQQLENVREVHISEMENFVIVNFEEVSHITFYLILMTSFLVTTCLLKVLLRFRDYVLMAGFVNLIPSVLQLTFLPALGIFIFALFGTLLFMPVLKNYCNLYYATIYTTVLLLERSTLRSIVEASQEIGKFYLIFFYSIMMYIILNYFIGLVNDMYSECKRQTRLKLSVSMT